MGKKRECFLCTRRHEKIDVSALLLPERGAEGTQPLPGSLAAQTVSGADAITSMAYRGRCGSLSALHTHVAFQDVNPFEIVNP